MTRRATALAAAFLGLALTGPGAALGAGETYVVIQCDPANREARDAVLREPRGYGITRDCAEAAGDNALRIQSRLSAGNGSKGSISWIAPPHTGFVRVRSEAKLRRDAGHRSRIFMADQKGRETRRIATGDGTAGAFHQEIWDGARQEQFVAMLDCNRSGGCPQSDAAKTWVREVRMTLADYSDPEVQIQGTVLGPGWVRDEQSLSSEALDRGSGLVRMSVLVNGATLKETVADCSGVRGTSVTAERLAPCPHQLQAQSSSVSTNAGPFRDGENSVAACVEDFAGNRTCSSRTALVDNAAPVLSFTSAQDPEDPELIHAVVSDPHSGVASGQIYYRREGATLWQPLETVIRSGELQARVDSTAVPAGNYEFRAVATDRAGNQTDTTRRQDGLTMRLAFPLKAGVDLSAALEPGGAKRMTVRYGKPARVAGIVRAAAGEPIANQRVTVVEYFGEGALIRERVTEVETDSQGRWQSKLPAGPSRQVTAYYAGTQRYLPAEISGGRLAVRTRASLRTSKSKVPEGGRVKFKGRLGRLGASIPSGGKLLELQVREDGNSYQTVGEGFRSKPDGSYRIGYRFGRFYQYDVRFKFRIKVAREANWPYKAPVRSRQRSVTVLAR